MKLLLLLLMLLISSSAFVQGVGTLSVEAFKNTTNDLNDNIQVQVDEVAVYDDQMQLIRSVKFNNVLSIRMNSLPPGTYTLICKTTGELDKTVLNISISSEFITFVKLLYEPNVKLTFSEKRRRKKQLFIPNS